jgi:hypothetical protein
MLPAIVEKLAFGISAPCSTSTAGWRERSRGGPVDLVLAVLFALAFGPPEAPRSDGRPSISYGAGESR